MKHCVGRFATWLFALVLFVLPCHATTGNVDLFYRSGSTPLVGATYEVYHLANYDPVASIVHVSPFDTLSLPATTLYTDRDRYCDTVENFINNHAPSALFTGYTDLDGYGSCFGLADGIYLVRLLPHEQDGKRHTSSPVLLEVVNEDHTPWTITLTPKDDTTSTTPSTISVTVNKIWRSDQSLDVRPTSIVVSLYGSGMLVDTVTLNDLNSWSYTWTGLSATAIWSIEEHNVPSGYMESYLKSGNIFTIQNTYTPEIEQDQPTPDTETDPPENSGSAGGNTGDWDVLYPEDGGNMNPDTGSGLPQTGALVWPIPILAVCGVVFLSIGLFLRRERD